MNDHAWAPVRRALVSAMSAALLVSCGGGGEDTSNPPPAKPEDTRRKPQAVFTPTTPIPADPYGAEG